MTTVLTVDEVRDRIDTHLSDVALGALLLRIEAELAEYVGAPFVDVDTPISQEFRGTGLLVLFLPRQILSVNSITEYELLSDGWDAGTVLVDGRDYVARLDRGQIVRRSGGWAERVVVSYVPVDDRHLWKEAELDLVRIAISRSALRSESVGGEYSYQAPEDWEAAKGRVIGRLGFLEV